jgi:hypothetical protein
METNMATIAVDNRVSLQKDLAWVIATFAAAGGLIHLEAAFDHRDLVVVAVGFAVMAVGQLVLAGVMLLRPTPAGLFGVGAVHAAIALLWIITRTIGLPFIPGAEQAAQVGVADVVANTFSIAIVGVAIVAFSLDRAHQALSFNSSTARAIRVVVLVGALILTVAGLSETHAHAQNDPDVSLSSDSHSHEHHDTP